MIVKSKKKILWTHNFSNTPGAGGVWMYNQHEFLKDEVDLYYLKNLRNPFWFVRHFLAIRRISMDYDIVHAQYGSAVGFLTSFAKSKRILSLKGSDWYCAPNPSLAHKIRIYVGSLLTRWSIKRYHHIIVMSDAMKGQVLDKFPQARIETIVDPIDLNKFSKQASPHRGGMKKILFASVNIQNPIKRFPLAKKSFEILQSDMPNVELVTMSNIPHSDVYDFMKKMDVLLLTSVHEGWPNVVKEMLALDKPFVSTRVSDLEKISKQTNSCFVCNDEPLELSQALKKSLVSPKENLRKFVIDFSMENSLKLIKKVYSQYL